MRGNGYPNENAGYSENAKKAFSLIERAASEPERLKILGNYYFVTGEWNKSAETFQLYASTYPRHAMPHHILFEPLPLHRPMGERLARSKDHHRHGPWPEDGYVMQVIYDCLLGRFKETKADLKAAFARNPDDWGVHEFVLGLAYLEGNHAAIERETPWFAGRPEAIWRSLLAQAQNADFWVSIAMRSVCLCSYGNGTALPTSCGPKTMH